MLGEGRRPPIDVLPEQLTQPLELKSEQELTKFWSTFRRNNGLENNDSVREHRLIALQTVQTLRDLEQNKPIHFFGIKAGEKIVATAKLEIRTKKDGKHGYLTSLTVDENRRGKGLAKQLTNARTGLARREGCTYIDTDVFTENPIALVTKLNDGYTLTDLEFYGDNKEAGKFVLSKKIDGEPEYDKKDGPLGELQEVELTNLSVINNLLGQGWVGIDAKNLGDPRDKNPKQWKLIMEQTNFAEKY